jgi:hypothetical protein
MTRTDWFGPPVNGPYRYQRYGTFVTANYEDAVYYAAFADFGPDGQMFIRSD